MKVFIVLELSEKIKDKNSKLSQTIKDTFRDIFT